jgi:hypothetical protein
MDTHPGRASGCCDDFREKNLAAFGGVDEAGADISGFVVLRDVSNAFCEFSRERCGDECREKESAKRTSRDSWC